MKLAFLLILLIVNLTCSFNQLTNYTNNTEVKENSDSLKLGEIIKCPKIALKIDGSGLIESSKDSVRIIAKTIKDNPNYKFELSYHTDQRGASNSNLEISKRYADFIKNYLIDNYNISPDQLISKGYGESQPIISIEEIEKADKFETEKLYSINRRFELKVLDYLSH
ncbi:MAG: OmpA family protein [Crocinitomicaceae bacterium]